MSKLANNTKWNAFNSISSQLINLVVGVLLMRILQPSDFGLIGMITVFSGFLLLLQDSGLSSSIIFQRDVSKVELDSIFWFFMFFSIAFSAVLFILSTPIAIFYSDLRLAPLIKVFSVSFILNGLTNIHFSLLKKELLFKKKFKIDILSNSFGGLFGIALSLLGFGVWSLICMNLAKQIINLFLSWRTVPYRPNNNFDWSVLRNHFSYSLPVLGTKSFNYWTRNADNFFIGKMLGSLQLGFYSRAYFFMVVPINQISNILGAVLFPFVRSKDVSLGDLRNIWSLAMTYTSYVTFPLVGGLIVLSDPFVRTVFGSEWLPMIGVLRILSIIGLFETVLVYGTTIFYATHRTKLNFYLSVAIGCTNIMAFYIGSLSSIEMVAQLLLASYLIFAIPKLYFVMNILKANYIHVKKLVNSFLINAFVMFSVAQAMSFASVKFELFFGILFYVVLYIVMHMLFNRFDFSAFLKAFKNLFLS